MTEEEPRLHAEGIAHGMGITVYFIRSHEGDYLLAQTPSDDCELVATVTPPGQEQSDSEDLILAQQTERLGPKATAFADHSRGSA